MEKTNERTASYDTLTGLPKLSLFKKRIEELIDAEFGIIDSEVKQFAIIYLDIDNFRWLKEVYGSEAADEVIKYVADYLVSVTYNTCFVSHTAADKFAIICTHVTDGKELINNVERILNNVCQTSPSEYIYYVTLSAGIVVYPDNGKDMASLMQNAETATYSAKKSGRGYKLYSEDLHDDMAGHMKMVNRLQAGIEKEEFILYYQPEYNLDTNKIIGVEALLRWPQPTKEFISPEKFIPVAEKSKQIYALERWVINTALQQKLQWEEEGLGHIEISINLSSVTLESESNFNRIEEIILSYQVDYTKIIFEITETVIIANMEQAIQRLERLRSYGIKIALDDFGTGYYSLNYLLKFPIDIIKIDRSFIKYIPVALEETAITKNILSMARDLNYMVVAEGIETREQLEYLKQNSCERGQGFLLSVPLPPDQLLEVLKQ